MIQRRLGVSATVVVLLLIVACGGGDDEPTPTLIPATPTSVPAPTATALPPTAVPTVVASPTPAPTPTPVPTATATPEPTATPSALSGAFFLERVEPSESELFTDSSTLEIVGRTRVDAVVTVNDDVVEPDADGLFRHTVSLEIGANIIEIVASVASDEQDSFIVTAVYLP